jgi:hypothetical protein
LSATKVKAKGKCCKDSPRCKRCPVVCKRLETAGLLERTGKRTWVLAAPVPKKQLKAARAR